MKLQMLKLKTIEPEFVEFIPEKLEEGILYISIPYGTASHNCACGCGERVVTPIKPTDWSIIWNGAEVTLFPSIGNWSFACGSHYWIEKNKILPAGKMSTAKIKAGREKDKRDKARYYSGTNLQTQSSTQPR